MIIAAAQTIPKAGNIAANIADHCRLATLAAAKGVQLILFPELSLTGYEREKATLLAFTPNDEKLDPLKKTAAEHNIIIVAGAPLKFDTGLHIGALIIMPDGIIKTYTKHFLHEGEEVVYASGMHDPVFALNDEQLSFAICADISHAEHPENAAAKGCSLYLAGIFYTPDSIDQAHRDLSNYAQQHSMNILMANYGGPSYEMVAAGQSAFWLNNGKCLGGMEGIGEGLVIATKENCTWKTKIITT